ncbi:bifunctional acetate--CoA ligase family protein/GNAT family N-acetyltransferase [Burkholderiaceae bacterium DAT-1]|nr:bifunctional acetate--CoA ligase family protein/GNAT family N-acetyltransferase [Burkholderiaceae bacterium DAT-1]
MDHWSAMKAHYLAPLFQPQSVAVIGASETAGSVGSRVYRNLLDAPFKGRLYGVNLRHSKVFDHKVWHRLGDLPDGPVDLAIITTPASTLLGLVEECGKAGVRHVLIISRDFVALDRHNRPILEAAKALAAKLKIRLLGPNLLGLAKPSDGLVALNYEGRIKPGNLALVSQSSAVASAMLDWAEAHDVGFSHVISLGAAADVNFGEILDFLAHDGHTRGILLYLEDIGEARTFMSAVRAAGRVKPVVAMKVGRGNGWAEGARTHAGKLISSDDAFDAAMRRVGVLRVNTMAQLNIAARMLAANYRTSGRKLAIISNGYGTGRMALDRARDMQIECPKLSDETIARLNEILPEVGNHANPVDLLGDAPPERFLAATEACLQDSKVDGVLVIYTPQAGTDHIATAQAMIDLKAKYGKLLMLVWLGDKRVAQSRRLLAEAKMAWFSTPEYAIEAFASLALYQYIQKLSLQTPGPLDLRSEPDVTTARKRIREALAQGRTLLNASETLSLMRAFKIPFVTTAFAADADSAAMSASTVGFPVALKVDADDLIHKTDIDAVALNLRNADQVREVAADMLARMDACLPAGSVHGLLVQAMHGRRHARELMIGVSRDPVFGPVIAFGAGGIAVEVFGDVAVTLPPINEDIAHSLIRRTRIVKALHAFRNLPPANIEAVADVLVRVSEMVCELPEIAQLDLNPLIVDEHGVVAVDASVIVASQPEGMERYEHMAIHPWPSHLIRQGTLKDGSPCVFRPIRPEDADELQRFVTEDLSEESRFNRFMSTLKQLSPVMLVRFTQLDYAREMALVATVTVDGEERMAGVSRYTINPDRKTCEFAISIGDQWQGKGLGALLMTALFDAARDKGLQTMEGEILSSNTAMLGLMKKLAFTIKPHPDDSGLKWVVREL